jgi:hypothetical protein
MSFDCRNSRCLLSVIKPPLSVVCDQATFEHHGGTCGAFSKERMEALVAMIVLRTMLTTRTLRHFTSCEAHDANVRSS